MLPLARCYCIFYRQSARRCQGKNIFDKKLDKIYMFVILRMNLYYQKIICPMSTCSTSWKKISGSCTSFLISFALGAFAVILLGHAFRGDPCAIALLLMEILLFAVPFLVDESKIPRWISSLWIVSAELWFPITGLWLLHLINII